MIQSHDELKAALAKPGGQGVFESGWSSGQLESPPLPLRWAEENPPGRASGRAREAASARSGASGHIQLLARQRCFPWQLAHLKSATGFIIFSALNKIPFLSGNNGRPSSLQRGARVPSVPAHPAVLRLTALSRSASLCQRAPVPSAQ